MPVEKTINLSFECYQDGLPHPCTTVEDLILGARELIHSSEDAEDGRVLLAKATRGGKTLLLSADRDNYEFSLRLQNLRSHVAGGVSASDLREITIEQLRDAMYRYLSDGTPLPIRKNTEQRQVRPSGRYRRAVRRR